MNGNKLDNNRTLTTQITAEFRENPPCLLCRPSASPRGEQAGPWHPHSIFFLLLIILLFNASDYAQTEYIPSDNPVYNFLERMESRQIINDYNSFEIPKTRNNVAGYLKEVILNENKLDEVDKKILGDLKIEFEFEIFNTLNNSESLIGSGPYDFFSQNEKYLFYLYDSSRANFFINILGEGEGIFLNSSSAKTSAVLSSIGGEIRGTFLNHFGFLLKGTNGFVSGSKQAATARKDLSYNYKLNETPDETFFDETEGYLTVDFDLLRFKFGRDRMKIGYGYIKSFLDDNSPLFDYLSFNLKYEFFSFSYFHGKLQGNPSVEFDSVSGPSNIVEEKYFGYHRLGFNISEDFDFGLGEMIIYGGRPLDFAYLNPFSFYKSIEHSNRDRDNAMLFFDFNNNSFEGLKLFFTFLIDDIKFGKIGTGWYGNQTAINAGLKCYSLYGLLPVDIQFEYLRLEPYTFTHRLSRNSFTNFGYNLGSFLQPNSELYFLQINYRFNHRLDFSVNWSYTLHGANPKNPDGSVKENVGGDILLGHRIFDSDEINFLDGDMEYYRRFSISLNFEPVNRYIITLRVINFNDSLQLKKSVKETQAFLKLGIRF
ncbi:MAG: capsule assembly Wzi family protein [Ignavibacteria bacterium]